jgi:hypothetical protein
MGATPTVDDAFLHPSELSGETVDRIIECRLRRAGVAGDPDEAPGDCAAQLDAESFGGASWVVLLRHLDVDLRVVIKDTAGTADLVFDDRPEVVVDARVAGVNSNVHRFTFCL